MCSTLLVYIAPQAIRLATPTLMTPTCPLHSAVQARSQRSDLHSAYQQVDFMRIININHTYLYTHVDAYNVERYLIHDAGHQYSDGSKK